MKQFILIEPYPGSPVKNTIVTFDEDKQLYTHPTGKKLFLELGLLKPSEVEDYPKNWIPFNRETLEVPMGSFIVFTKTKLKFVAYEVLTTLQNPEGTKVQLRTLDKKFSEVLRVPIINLAVNSGHLQVFDTGEEAENFIINNIPVLSLTDVATIYSSAVNPNYAQSEAIIELIKSKLC